MNGVRQSMRNVEHITWHLDILIHLLAIEPDMIILYVQKITVFVDVTFCL